MSQNFPPSKQSASVSKIVTELLKYVNVWYNSVLLVICREDLPPNPLWRVLSLPDEHCWDPDILFAFARYLDDVYYSEARRIWWEMWWRYHGHYSHRHRFPDVYECVPREEKCTRVDTSSPVRRLEVIRDVLYSAFTWGLVPWSKHATVSQTTGEEALRKLEQILHAY